jgi:hypothetical protein
MNYPKPTKAEITVSKAGNKQMQQPLWKLFFAF